MNTEIEAAVQRAASVLDRVAESIGGRGLLCTVCATRIHADIPRIREYLQTGWPECCGRTMRLE